MAKCGHEIHIVSNAWDVEEEYRQYLIGSDLDHMKDKIFSSGGKITHHFTNPFFEPKYIPFAHPYVTKLASKAIEVIKKYACEKIFAYYIEPYGISAFLVSQITGVPYYVKHAGSDITRLIENPEFTHLYEAVLEKSNGVLTTHRSINKIRKVIQDETQIKLIASDFLPQEYFKPEGEKLDVETLLNNLDQHAKKVKILDWNSGVYYSKKMNIGIYCKAGRNKGFTEVIDALSQIENVADKVNLLLLTGGSNLRSLQNYVKKTKVSDTTFFIPFLPPWRIPSFLRRCDVVCALENNFSVPVHGPRIPREILSCGRCMVISKELLNKQVFSNDVVHKGNAIVIDTVKDIYGLSHIFQELISSPDLVEQIGLNAVALARKHHLYSSDQFLQDFQSALGIGCASNRE
jgi:glycosyltransferase involved in cell wall biosynthesis